MLSRSPQPGISLFGTHCKPLDISLNRTESKEILFTATLPLATGNY